MWRTLAERLSRNRAFKRQIETSYGSAPLLVSPDSQLKYLKPGGRSFDQDLIALAQLLVRPGNSVWDIGANVGVFSVAAALVPEVRVLAVDADAWLGQLLRRTASLQTDRPEAIEVLIAAVAARDGVERFQIAARGRASNALVTAGGRSMMGGVRDVQLVPVLSLDTLAESLGPPDLIKIDVEGAEAQVIQGGLNLLRDHRPLVYAEIGADHFESIARLLAPIGYAMFGTDRRPATTARDENYFLLPRSRLDEPILHDFV